jgi:two-component system chemotaxis response regulator CheB
MGTDGTEGAFHVKSLGGRIITQDELTSAVYGMPQSVTKAGCADWILPLPKIAEGIVHACEN